MNRAVLLLLLAAAAPDGMAKCAAMSYSISGLVVGPNGAPVRGALVGVSWIERSEPAGPAITVTDENGAYSIPLAFDTYSGYSLWGDKCDGELTQISLSASTKGEHAAHLLVPVPQGQSVSAPRIQLEHPVEQEPGR